MALDFENMNDLEGATTIGFIVLREVLGEKVLRSSFSENTFYKYRKLAANVKNNDVDNLSANALRAIIAVVAPDLLETADAKGIEAAGYELLKRITYNSNTRSKKKPKLKPRKFRTPLSQNRHETILPQRRHPYQGF
jgi:hypothetical protein